MDQSVQRKLVVGAVAAVAVVGVGAVAGAAVGAGPLAASGSGNDSARDLAERGPNGTTDSSTPGTTPDSLPDDSGTTVAGERTETRTFVDVPDGTTQTFAAGTAGFVTVTRNGGVVSVVAVSPGTGWTFEIEPGDEPGEAEVDFRSGGARVQFNAELEDGSVRIRVRTRGVATPDPTVGTLPSDTLPRDDNSGPGSANSGPGSVDDNSGPGSSGGGGLDDGPNHDVGDDHGGSGGGGSDDSSGSGGNSGPG